MALEISSQQLNPSTALITLTGRLMLGPEGAQLEALVKQMLASGVRSIIFEFSGLTHIDSTGIGRCIASLNLVMQAKGQLVIAGATGQVREGFRVTQLDRVFQFSDDIPSAQAVLSK